MRRFLIGAVLLLLTLAVAGGGIYYVNDRRSGPLPDGERITLLHRAGLPADFPVHPGARRMPQAKQGGFSYAVRAPVPDAVTWVRDALLRSGYLVHSGDVQGSDVYLTRWLDFQGRAAQGTVRGAVLVRQIQGSAATTEVKILSQTDERLIAPLLQAPPK